MLVLVGPSASGKSAIVKYLIKNNGLEKFITCTTRSMRVGEVDGVDYYFLTNEMFSKCYENNEFIETVFYNGNYYGTFKKEVKDTKVVILEPQGLNNFIAAGVDCFVVFLQTNEDVLEKRMISRGDSPLEVSKRLQNDRILFDVKQLNKVDYIIDTTNLSIEEISARIMKEYINYSNIVSDNIFNYPVE